jgi:hypothetical protein
MRRSVGLSSRSSTFFSFVGNADLENSQVAFTLVLFERFDATRGNIGNAAIKRREGIRVRRWPIFVRRVPEIIQPCTCKFCLIVREIIYELVERLARRHSRTFSTSIIISFR